MINVEPMKPNCSPAALNTKSVCCSGTIPWLVWAPWNRPWPNQPPWAMAIRAWSTLYPVPWVSVFGWAKLVNRASWY